MKISPRRFEIRRPRPVSPTYGARRRQREISRAPLLAQLPGWVATEDEYAQQMVAESEVWTRKRRSTEAAAWRKVLRWRAGAGPDERALFERKWRNLPHSSEYALDLIRRIDPLGLHEVDEPGASGK